MDRASKVGWKEFIESSKAGADFFITKTPAEYNPEAYFKHRGATSSLQDLLTRELSEWIQFFSTSDKQIHHDIANSLKSYRKQSNFWDQLAERESQQRQSEQLMEQRKLDLRGQNVHQLRIDGEAMTRELLDGRSESYTSVSLKSPPAATSLAIGLSKRKRDEETTSSLEWKRQNSSAEGNVSADPDALPSSRLRTPSGTSDSEIVGGSDHIRKQLIDRHIQSKVGSPPVTYSQGLTGKPRICSRDAISTTSTTGDPSTAVRKCPRDALDDDGARLPKEPQLSKPSHTLISEESGVIGPPALRVLQESTEVGETGSHTASGSSTGQKQGQSRRVSFGISLTLDDLSTRLEPSVDDDDPSKITPPIYSPASSLRTEIASTDPGDTSFVDQGDPTQSTSRLYSWNFLDGEGRVDSDVDSHWKHNGTVIGADLMRFRTRTVENNGGLTDAYQKLAVNFIFLVEEEYRTDGLQEVLDDEIWETLYDAVRDRVQQLPNSVVIEAYEWAHRMANMKMEEFERMLDESPPEDRNLRAILTGMASNLQHWNTQERNEDTFLKSMLGPFLDTYFGKLKYTKSDWTPTQDDTTDADSSTLIPDYGTATLIGLRRYFVLLLEGKIADNAGQCQMWDDLTKLGMEMKSALDSILKLMPSSDVCVIGILVHEPSTEFYSMRIHAEGTYVMYKFASAFIASGATNAFPLIRLMEICDHAKRKVEQTVSEIRRVKVLESSNPKVPLSWLRPSFKKPKRYLITDYCN
ncbi:hypothetical protein BGZ65_004275, partial [Modicella reniformis]